MSPEKWKQRISAYFELEYGEDRTRWPPGAEEIIERVVRFCDDRESTLRSLIAAVSMPAEDEDEDEDEDEEEEEEK